MAGIEIQARLAWFARAGSTFARLRPTPFAIDASLYSQAPTGQQVRLIVYLTDIKRFVDR